MSFPERILDHILPAATPILTRILASNVDRLLELDSNEIRHLWDPWKIKIDDLPYLAWALSVDIWDTNWPDDKKRRVVANALIDHKKKGTLSGISQYLDYENVSIEKSYQPPQTTFGIVGLTSEQREAYIATLPQIRVYPFVSPRITAQARSFMSGPGGFKNFYSPESFMQISEGLDLYGRNGAYVVPGQEDIPVSVDSLDPINGTSAETIKIDFIKSKRFFFGSGFYNNGYMRETRAGDNVITVKFSGSSNSLPTAITGGKVQDVRPLRTYEKRIPPIGRFFMGRNFFGSQLSKMQTTYAPRLIYDRFAIIDPKVTPKLNPGRSFMGFSRFGIAPFTAELRLEIPMNRPRWILGVGRGQFLTGFIKKTNFEKLDRSIDAIKYSKSFRDTILIDPEIYRTVRLGDGLKLGRFKLNQQVKRT